LTSASELPPVFGRVRPRKETDNEAVAVCGSADHWDLKDQECGTLTAAVCRKNGINSAAFYKYKARFGGMNVSEAQRLKSLHDGNAKLQRLLAEPMLEMAILKDVAAKKW
jgi:putative transposase